VLGVAIPLLYQQYDVRLPGALRLCLIIFGAIAAVWFSGLGGTVPSENRWLIWGTPAASIFAGVVLGDEINFGRLTAPIKLLGDASYALYLSHPFVATTILLLWGRLSHHPLWFVFPLSVVVSIVLSIAIFWFFERRATVLARALLNSSRRNEPVRAEKLDPAVAVDTAV
jgi:exopolysaccharide production protein ExoZ